MSATLYYGPGKIYYNSVALWPEGDGGQIDVTIDQEKFDAYSGMHGRTCSLGGDLTAKISLTPFDNWGALAITHPASIKTPAVGTRAHGAADVSAAVWTPDGRGYLFAQAAVTKHPDLHLGPDKALFGPMEFTCLVDRDLALGATSSLVTVTESSAADPGGQMTMTDFARGRWTGVWGTEAGFGGAEGDVAIEAEDEWIITADVKYAVVKAAKLTRAMVLQSVDFMARVVPYGPTHTQILTALGLVGGATAASLGARWAVSDGADLVLTGPNSKTITLKNCHPVGAGFRFGGSRLGTGEIGFVTGMTFTDGAVQPLIVFSA